MTDDPITAYGQAWVATDADERAALLAVAWAPDAVYSDPLDHVQGREALAQHIGATQVALAGGRVAVTSTPVRHHDSAFFRWSTTDAAGATVLTGFDVVQLDADGRIARLTGFFDTDTAPGRQDNLPGSGFDLTAAARGPAMTTTAQFWFDPTCPFTWATSCWLRDTAPAQGARVEWRLMSLAVLNEGKDVPEPYRSKMAESWRLLRLLAATARTADVAAVGALYAALGTRIHEQRRAVDDALLAESLQEAGLPADLLGAADDPSHDEHVRSSHTRAQEAVGTEIGSPVLALGDGPAWFGPVVAPVPTGQAASELWQGLVSLSGVAQFAELKRGRAPLHG